MASTTRQRLVVTVSHSLAPSRATLLLLAAVMIAACGGQTAVAGGESAPVAAPQLASPGVPSPSTAAIDPEPSPGSVRHRGTVRAGRCWTLCRTRLPNRQPWSNRPCGPRPAWSSTVRAGRPSRPSMARAASTWPRDVAWGSATRPRRMVAPGSPRRSNIRPTASTSIPRSRWTGRRCTSPSPGCARSTGAAETMGSRMSACTTERDGSPMAPGRHRCGSVMSATACNHSASWMA